MPLFLCTPEKYQFALGTELMRAPELLFQPSMIGHEQGGLSETIEHVLKSFTVEEQSRLVNDIYIMGNYILWVLIALLTTLLLIQVERRAFQEFCRDFRGM